jgi:hypothetical protein
MRTFLMIASLYLATGGLAAMAVQSLTDHSIQHSGTQRYERLRAYLD